MSKLNQFFLTKVLPLLIATSLTSFAGPSPYLFEQCKQIKKILLQMIKEKAAKLNKQNADGDTFLHLVLKNHYDGDIVKAALESGANPTILNKENESAVDILLRKYKIYSLLLREVFHFIQIYHPDETSIIKMFSKYSSTNGISLHCSTTDITASVNLRLLPVQTLQALLKKVDVHIDNIKTGDSARSYGYFDLESAEKFKDKIENHMLLLDKAYDLPFILNDIFKLGGADKNIIFRAILINDPPLQLLLEKLLEHHSLIAVLSAEQQSSLKAFMKQYEKRRVILEELSAIPTPLTASELTLVKPLCVRLENLLYCLDSAKDADWVKRITNYEQRSPIPPANRVTQQAICIELSQYKKSIKQKNFLGEHGLYKQIGQRKKCAQAAEKRIESRK